MKDKKKRRKSSPLLVIGVLLICAGLVGMSWWFLKKSMADIGSDKTLRQPQTEQSQTQQPAVTPEEPPVEEEDSPVVMDTQVVDQPQTPVEEAPPAEEEPEEEAPPAEEEPEEEPEEEAPPQEADPPAEDGYLLDSSSRKLTEEDVAHLSLQQLNYARNEIYARYGRKFKSKELQAYFNSKSWYKGTIDPSAFNEDRLTVIERYNVEFLYEYEHKLNPAGYKLDAN